MPRVTASADRGAEFRADGVILIRDAISAEWRERLAAAIERDIADPGPHFHGYDVKGGRFHGNLRLWEHDPDFRDYCFRSPLPDLAAELLDDDRIVLFYDQLFVKEPGAEAPTRWHNDQPYWPIGGWPVISFWTSLDPVDETNGRLEFVRGSHRWNRWFQPQAFAPGGARYDTNPNYEETPDIDADRASFDIVAWDMQPGDVLAFHGLTVHGGGPNRNMQRRRRGYTVRYCGSTAYYRDEPGVNAELRNASLRHGDPLASAQYPLVRPLSL